MYMSPCVHLWATASLEENCCLLEYVHLQSFYILPNYPSNWLYPFKLPLAAYKKIYLLHILVKTRFKTKYCQTLSVKLFFIVVLTCFPLMTEDKHLKIPITLPVLC